MSNQRQRHSGTLLSIVAPVYNEREVIGRFVEELQAVVGAIAPPVVHEVILVNDGSTDGSGQKLSDLAARWPGQVKVVHLSRNFGHAAAVMAGLDQAAGDATIVMDSDLQDDPQAIGQLLAKWEEGYDVAYAVRTSRQELLLQRLLFRGFYRALNFISETPFPLDAGNYSLMDRRVLELLRSMPERNRYLPGLRAWVGFRQTGVAVPRRRRHDGRSRVGLRGLWKLSMNAVFSFSYFPLFVFRAIGMLSLLSCACLVAYALYHKLVTGAALTAWTSQIVTVAFFGGINLLGIGVVGEYVARIYDELKQRPPYVIDRVVGKAAAAPSVSAEREDGVERFRAA